MIHETPRDRSWSRPEVLAMSHETPRPQGSRLGSDELFVARSDPDPNSTRPSPKRTLWRPVDQPALRSLSLRSFIFNAPTTFPFDLHRRALCSAALKREKKRRACSAQGENAHVRAQASIEDSSLRLYPAKPRFDVRRLGRPGPVSCR